MLSTAAQALRYILVGRGISLTRRGVGCFFSGFGLAMILVFPLSFVLIAFDYAIRPLFENLGIEAGASDLVLPGSILSLVGLGLWLTGRRCFKARSTTLATESGNQDRLQRVHFLWAWVFVILSSLGGIGILGIFLLFLLAVFVSDYPPDWPNLLMPILALGASVVVDFAVTFLIARFYWRLQHNM